jgi:ureidoglycolate hydrolase/3-hydroxyisobutyrate dehydrogenase-like beta-hydroxyacid dehydrogenase
MTIETVAILSPGDMGHAVGRALAQHGLNIVTCLAGRSERTRNLAAAAALEDVETLEILIERADLILSIMPPSAALETASVVAEAMRAVGHAPCYADCNATSPMTAKRIAAVISERGGAFVDAGIIGPPPGKAPSPTRFYVSGPQAPLLQALDGGPIAVHQMGPEIGRASAMKMCYASLTKGTWTLYAAALVTAEEMGLSEALLGELAASRPAVEAEMRRMVPRLPVDAGRWVGEMEEIAATFAQAGLPTGFHQGAAEVFRMLERTPIARETRETLDPNRTLEQALALYRDALPGRQFAGAVAPGGRGSSIVARPLDAAGFAPFGDVIAVGVGSPGTRDNLVAAMENRRDHARLAPTMSRNAPTAMPLRVQWMERHPHSSQTFIPHDLERYLILVAPSAATGDPRIDRLQAFVADSSQGINYRPDVWHHPFTALDRPSECFVLRYDDGSKADTDWFEVADGPVIRLADG